MPLGALIYYWVDDVQRSARRDSGRPSKLSARTLLLADSRLAGSDARSGHSHPHDQMGDLDPSPRPEATVFEDSV
jgi:hypothetical protein